MGRRLVRVLYAWIPSSLREFVSLHFARSRLGKRIVLLLLICGLVPPILFSFPLYYQTYDVRREDAIESLRSYATISRRRIRRALERCRNQLEGWSMLRLDLPEDSNLFSRLQRRRDRGAVLRGVGEPWAALDEPRRIRLERGEVVASSPYRSGDRVTLSLMVEHPGGGVILGEVKPSRLWKVAENPFFSRGNSFAVLDRQGRVLVSSLNGLRVMERFPVSPPETKPGHGRSKMGEHPSAYWASAPLRLRNEFGVSDWRVVITRRMSAVEELPRKLLETLSIWAIPPLLGLVIFAFYLARRFHEPIDQLIRATNRLAQGDWSTEPEVDTGDEIEQLADSFVEMRDKLERSRQQLRYDALHDQLTDLPNRTLLEDRLQQNLEYARGRDNYAFSVLFMDLDRFKRINDSHGHPAGDRLLRAFADRVQQCLRPPDTLARLGGDEFVAVLDDVGDHREASQFAQRIVEQLSEPFHLEQQQVFTSVSIGIVVYESDYETPEDLIRDADTAMFTAKKRNKKNAYAVFGQDMRREARDLLSLETDLQRATLRKDFELRFQPIVDLRTGRATGCEVLLRWEHSERGWISPGTFIPMAEEANLMTDIGEWIFRDACRRWEDWNRRRSVPLNWLSINVSGQQLTQEGLLDLVTDLQASFGTAPGDLKLEVTETSLIEETHRALETLETLRERGFSICLDDFGTGYSSLSLVHTFPLDILKIDLHFVRDIHLDSHNQAIVRGIMSMARQLDLKVVAEGIETRKELDYLLEVIGCDFGQGYLFARPMDAGELLDRLGEPRPFGSDALPALNAPS